jgi:Icc protein
MKISRRWRLACLPVLLGAWLLGNRAAAQKDAFRFVILGDRTGSTQPGVYEQVWQEAAAENPAFVVSVGDSIEGSNDATAEAEWLQLERILRPYSRYPLLLAPGNHDVWSARSEALFQKHAAHPVHYSFDYQGAHVTVLDNSRSEQFSAGDLQFLEQDLQAHQNQPMKFVVFHRPSWLIDAMFQNPRFPLHQLAKKYGVRYVIAGHLHQMLDFELDRVTYISMVSSGGHLRGSEQYQDGWFFGYALASVSGQNIDVSIKELHAPRGQGRITELKAWRKAGSATASP